MTRKYSLHFMHNFFIHTFMNHSMLVFFYVCITVGCYKHIYSHIHVINNTITSYFIYVFFYVHIDKKYDRICNSTIKTKKKRLESFLSINEETTH